MNLSPLQNVETKILCSGVLTFEYMRQSGKLIAIDNNQTKIILSVTRRRVLFRPNFIGYFNDKYRSTLIVHKCIIDAVQNNTSKQIHTRQYTDGNGKKPETKKRKSITNLKHFQNIFYEILKCTQNFLIIFGSKLRLPMIMDISKPSLKWEGSRNKKKFPLVLENK